MIKNKDYLRKVLTYFLKQKKELMILLIISLVNIVISIIEPFIIAKEYSSIVNIDISNIIKYTIIIFIVDALSTILYSTTTLVGDVFSKKVEIVIQKDITKELFKLEIKNFDKKGTDFFIERAISDSKNLVLNIGHIRYQILNIVSSCGIIVYVMNASMKLFLLLMFFSFILLYINKKSRDIYEKNIKKEEKLEKNKVVILQN